MPENRFGQDELIRVSPFRNSLPTFTTIFDETHSKSIQVKVIDPELPHFVRVLIALKSCYYFAPAKDFASCLNWRMATVQKRLMQLHRIKLIDSKVDRKNNQVRTRFMINNNGFLRLQAWECGEWDGELTEDEKKLIYSARRCPSSLEIKIPDIEKDPLPVRVLRILEVSPSFARALRRQVIAERYVIDCLLKAMTNKRLISANSKSNFIEYTLRPAGRRALQDWRDQKWDGKIESLDEIKRLRKIITKG